LHLLPRALSRCFPVAPRIPLVATSRRPRPCRLPTVSDLLRIADETAEDFLCGRYDHLVPATGRFPDDQRWSHRLYADDDLDVWLISWAPGHPTVLHDHAGSLGALIVLSGSLRELRWTGSDLRERILRAGDQATFPFGWVHDVEHAPGDDSNLGPMDPTLSVHWEDSVTLRPCKQRPATKSALSWHSSPLVTALLRMSTVVADPMPVGGLVSVLAIDRPPS
jgi:Cysteine dioxygenase type I